MADVLLWVADVMPDMMGGSNTEDFLMFLIVFLGSTDYIKNPFLRAKLVEVRIPAHQYCDVTHTERGHASLCEGTGLGNCNCNMFSSRKAIPV